MSPELELPLTTILAGGEPKSRQIALRTGKNSQMAVEVSHLALVILERQDNEGQDDDARELDGGTAANRQSGTLGRASATARRKSGRDADWPTRAENMTISLTFPAWTGATADKKAAALVMATRLIDSQFQFSGSRTNEGQALQWPRAECRDPHKGLVTLSALLPILSNFVPYDSVPSAVVQATCEMARELLIVDRTGSAPGEGVESVQTVHAPNAATGTTSSSDTSATKYSKADAANRLARCAGDVGEVRGGDQQRGWGGAAGEGVAVKPEMKAIMEEIGMLAEVQRQAYLLERIGVAAEEMSRVLDRIMEAVP